MIESNLNYDVIFVIDGTNKPIRVDADVPMRIGAPADSLNFGSVLSFFHKPDISYFGGDYDDPMRACEPLGEAFVSGTSFSAP